MLMGYLDEDNPYNSKEIFLDKFKKKLPKESFTDTEWDLLTNNENFCILPWTHVHGWSDGTATPCCISDKEHPIGNFRTDDIETIWNSPEYRKIRRNMLDNKPSPQCSKCYETEKTGSFSMRQGHNRTLAYNIGAVNNTDKDGNTPVNIKYWDIRFSNLCNFKCRMCGPIFSSQLANESNILHNKKGPVLQLTTDSVKKNWQLIEPYLDSIDAIYFAGGEPLMMEEHWKILKLFLDNGRTDVSITYNTNFSNIYYKKESVFDYWKEFEQVHVGVSLDAMGPQAEYIRKGTNWDTIVRNRELMMKECPNTGFLVASTIQILNSYNLPKFHKDWMKRGLIGAGNVSINLLFGPNHLRLDALPQTLKDELRNMWEEHIDYLNTNNIIGEHDDISRAKNGWESAINFMDANQNQHYLKDFKNHIDKYDKVRGESFVDTFPELKLLWD
jgi:sulfatase maturation enzyme AslB (radical SAM superfamily)